MNNYKVAREEVARLINVELKDINYVLYKIKVENSYLSFEIPKKNGEVRIINAPNNTLKRIQRRISEKLSEIHLDFLVKNGIKPIISHGFEKNKSIITNAYRHKKKKYLLNIDIHDFFSSFNFGRVQGFFYKSREFMFSKEISTIIAQLVCYNGKLPQGAPTSPIISNLIFNIVDLRISELTKKYKLEYTRYADDMSFSTNNKAFRFEYIDFVQELTDILRKNGFEINQKKTRLVYFSSRQEVTGLTVNNKINANGDFINNTRAMANQLYKNNIFQIRGENGDLKQLEGRFSFINQMDKWNNELKNRREKEKNNNRKPKKKCHLELNAREKQYQYFLFYKYFFNPIKPTIVTEGKTDILHIKAALMKYYYKYPKLITKINGKYEFKVYFLNRTKRLRYFLNISMDGGDTFKNIWNYYNGKDNCKNIFEYIKIKNSNNTLEKVNPVILLLDNEQENAKPLRKFKAHSGVELDKNQISIPLIGNLFLQTIPLVNDLKECEIEDLYDKDDINMKIKWKTFSSKIDDSGKYFDKQEFAIKIIQNYEKIDFSNFLQILDSINNLV